MNETQTIHEIGNQFSRELMGLPRSVGSDIVDLAAGATFSLRVAPVVKRIGDIDARMLAYNGSIPGPVLRVRQGSEVTIEVTNQGDLETTVHWHGLRVENRYDGTHETQIPIQVGSSSTYRLRFPDPGIYWYHPHVREDYGQELGLYGNILVVPRDADYWPPVNREVVLTLDDILIEAGQVAPFNRHETNHVAMGRFGNSFLAGGETDPLLTANAGEVVRFYLTNTANTRIFNVRFNGAQMKLVGGDSGRFEMEQFVHELLLAPSERYVVDVLFDQPGLVTLDHRTPQDRHRLATVGVSTKPATPSLRNEFHILRQNADMREERRRIESYVDAPSNKTLSFVAEMDSIIADGSSATSYSCPMHPEVVSESPSRCPECGMKLMPVSATNHVADAHAMPHQHEPESQDGIEWEDGMVEINRLTTPANMRWKLIDRDTGQANRDIDWTFKAGDQVKIRLINESASDHPMHHPFHIHGAGRFLILSRDGVMESNLVWKDTVLIRAGQTVDILLEISNPGRWMAHCHIAEHHEGGMMFSFNVGPADSTKSDLLPASSMKDPVCGMALTEPPNETLSYNGNDYAFCSDGCRAKFAANPESYV
ncbi:MAG TPA: multicopper oxidase domain-containing protein [Terriglobia bacterium]|nr:multicopper oxidase domain-containing protein [Terriglobia bacterium]